MHSAQAHVSFNQVVQQHIHVFVYSAPVDTNIPGC
jgi:hypothetical protein